MDALIKTDLPCLHKCNELFSPDKENNIINEMKRAYKNPFTECRGISAYNTPGAREKLNADYFALSYD